MQYKKLYTGVSAENEQLRAENGDLLRGLSAHSDALRAENARLHARLDRAQQELDKLRKLLEAAQRGGGGGGGGAAADDKAAEGVSKADLEGVGEDQNLLELRIERADLEVSVDVGTFFTVDFYDHPTQVRGCARPCVAEWSCGLRRRA